MKSFKYDLSLKLVIFLYLQKIVSFSCIPKQQHKSLFLTKKTNHYSWRLTRSLDQQMDVAFQQNLFFILKKNQISFKKKAVFNWVKKYHFIISIPTARKKKKLWTSTQHDFNTSKFSNLFSLPNINTFLTSSSLFVCGADNHFGSKISFHCVLIYFWPNCFFLHVLIKENRNIR